MFTWCVALVVNYVLSQSYKRIVVDGSVILLVQVMNGAILQQVFVVEFVIQGQMCDDCHRVEAKDFWNSVVQVRQKVPLMIRIILFMLLTTTIIFNMLCW